MISFIHEAERYGRCTVIAMNENYCVLETNDKYDKYVICGLLKYNAIVNAEGKTELVDFSWQCGYYFNTKQEALEIFKKDFGGI